MTSYLILAIKFEELPKIGYDGEPSQPQALCGS